MNLIEWPRNVIAVTCLRIYNFRKKSIFNVRFLTDAFICLMVHRHLIPASWLSHSTASFHPSPFPALHFTSYTCASHVHSTILYIILVGAQRSHTNSGPLSPSFSMSCFQCDIILFFFLQCGVPFPLTRRLWVPSVLMWSKKLIFVFRHFHIYSPGGPGICHLPTSHTADIIHCLVFFPVKMFFFEVFLYSSR